MVKDPPFNSRDVHWIPGWRAKIPHTCRVTKPFGARGPGRSRALDPQQEKPSCMLQLSATTEILNSQKREEKQKCHLNLLTVTEGDEQHHWLNGREFEQTLGNGEGQGTLACWSPRGHKELDTTQQLNSNSLSLVALTGGEGSSSLSLHAEVCSLCPEETG